MSGVARGSTGGAYSASSGSWPVMRILYDKTISVIKSSCERTDPQAASLLQQFTYCTARSRYQGAVIKVYSCSDTR